MTLRKYKKILMSYGIDRDQAEHDRKSLARLKCLAVKDGCDPACVMLKRGDAAEAVAYRKRSGTTSRRDAIRKMKKWMRNVTVV